ncbi:uncharacterized protein EDB91DRAFT_1157489 [Suillus paluster]|uniref:uncharacterized protein n=1 Tax=Suillus paluster TaxID=48578 RepID=UPI001B883825|nr:uncharacterized protein EDB91DRAFT_1157489 [Suillus paluster]KAG1730243.1 hypothetical protein EDB91DRAFT_1157489 [Suillus paluster]
MRSPYANVLRPSPRPSPSSRRPSTIAELSERALSNLWDPSKGLKQWLKKADGFRKAGRAYAEAGELEEAFMEYAKSATIILEKLPMHKEYYTLLSPTQRHNLGLNGHQILVDLGEIKPIIVDRYERWRLQNIESSRPSSSSDYAEGSRHTEYRRHDDGRRSPHDDSGWLAQEAARKDADRKREEQRRGDEARYSMRSVETQPPRLQIDTGSRKKEDALTAARRAANAQLRDSTYYQHEGTPSEPGTPLSPEERRGERDQRDEQDEVRRRRRREQEGILKRQEEAEFAAREARRSLVPSPMPAASAAGSQRSSFVDPQLYEDAAPLLMPIESPTRNHAATPTSLKPPSYPPPVTTTSPAPPDGHIQYPELMSQHQLKQGYAPSLQSMFNYPTLKPTNLGRSSLLFVPESSQSSTNPLPNPSVVVLPSQPAPYPYSQTTTRSPSGAYIDSITPYSSLSRAPQATPPPPPPPLHHIDGDRYRTASQESARITRKASDPVRVPDLKTVSLPRECLPRFLSIASLNTVRNRETCGLLLGKDRGNKFTVTTLLIPRQHSTSDTCTMDEEELVLQFTEERSLITLGWIHTHPSQSCFMSSVDLHTHSGFQRMLPESFAVVCAPKFTPNFGIFRLTDPPGLQTILDCNVKEAFHPHPEVPIYTDADKGHVQMKDIPLEIVDLR